MQADFKSFASRIRTAFLLKPSVIEPIVNTYRLTKWALSPASKGHDHELT